MHGPIIVFSSISVSRNIFSPIQPPFSLAPSEDKEKSLNLHKFSSIYLNSFFFSLLTFTIYLIIINGNRCIFCCSVSVFIYFSSLRHFRILFSGCGETRESNQSLFKLPFSFLRMILQFFFHFNNEKLCGVRMSRKKGKF